MLLSLVFALGSAGAEPLSLEQARTAIEQPEPATRQAAVERLAEIGTMADVDRLVVRLADADLRIRVLATAALWRVWSRSGEPAVDALLERGIEQMQNGDFEGALATFTAVVGRKPEFAEGWNKRATVLFLMGRHEASLKDCDEVLRRNPKHFGALSGAGQNHAELGHLERALDFYRRALAVNPNLHGVATSIRVLEQHLRGSGRNKA
jgi:tetratricopeptide (TPR) repeat protein